MTALVLGAAGAYVGSFAGPTGASIGWSIGSAMASLVDPEKTEGPRLTDLKVQTSQYGQPIPIPYGRVRLAGNVIWASDFQEHEQVSGGKGGPVVREITYTCSWAVLLCEGPIVAISRAWADGRLVHDNVDVTSAAQLSFPFTSYLGDEEQLPDPTMESYLGAGNVPAHRGHVYVVFTDFDVTPYGNRLPALEFEVMTEAIASVIPRCIQSNFLPHVWNFSWFGEHGGIGEPYIMQWPGAAGDQFIKIKRLDPPLHWYGSDEQTGNPAGLGRVLYYDPETLEYLGSDAYPGPGLHLAPSLAVPGVSGPTHFILYTLDHLLWSNGNVVRYFMSISASNPAYLTKSINMNPPLSNQQVWSDDGYNLWTAMELAHDAGMAEGLEICGVYFTQDHTAAFIFSTVPEVDYNRTQFWDMVVDGVVVESGTVDDAYGFGGLFFGGPGGLGNTNAGMFENNRKWLWVYGISYGFVYFIDDNNVLRVFRDIYTHPQDFLYSIPDGHGDPFGYRLSFAHPAVEVIREGYCGVLSGGTLGICSRLPLYDATAIPLSDVVADICERVGLTAALIDVATLADDKVKGFIIGVRGSARAALAQLQSAYFFDAVESEGKLKFVKRGRTTPVTVSSDDVAATLNEDQRPANRKTVRLKEEELPRRLNVTYFDVEMDYQPGTQHATRDTRISERLDSIELAIVMTPIQAKQVASLLIYDAWLEREQFSVSLPRKYAHYEPTDLLVVEDREMRVTQKVEEPEGLIRLEGVPDQRQFWHAQPSGGATSLGYEAVRGGGGGAALAKITEVMLMDLPLVYESDPPVGMKVAMAPASAGNWLGAELLRSRDGGTTYATMGSHTKRDTIGMATTALGEFFGGNMFDELNTVDIHLLEGAGGAPESKTELLVINGANLAVLGSEIIQYKNAEALGNRSYRLSGLLRGRSGTEWAMSEHIVNDRFAVLPVRDYVMAVGDLRVDSHYKALTLGQIETDAPVQLFTLNGIASKPLSPVHLSGWSAADGTVDVSWIRRTRRTAPWRNYIDAPLGEEVEAYVVQIWNAGYTKVARKVEGLIVTAYQYTAAMQVADFGVIQRTVYWSVLQVGSHVPGYEAFSSVAARGSVNTANPLLPQSPYTGTFATPSPVGATVDERHFANFSTIFADDRQLAYKYTQQYLVQNWFIRWQFEIVRIFRGDTWAFNLWIMDADANRMILDDIDAAYIDNLMRQAVYGEAA